MVFVQEAIKDFEFEFAFEFGIYTRMIQKNTHFFQTACMYNAYA